MRKTSLCILLLVLMACTPEKREPVKPANPTMTVEQVETARQALVEWFECEECEEGQLEAVVKYGERAVPTLRAALLEGASPASEELLRRDLATRYDELQRYAAANHPEGKVASSKEEFVAMYVGNLHAQYKTRAAQALSRIGGAAAAQALEEGLGRADRDDVRTSIETALKSIRK